MAMHVTAVFHRSRLAYIHLPSSQGCLSSLVGDQNERLLIPTTRLESSAIATRLDDAYAKPQLFPCTEQDHKSSRIFVITRPCS